MYGNITASDRGPRFQDVAQEPWLVEETGAQNRRKRVFPGVCERLGKYYLDLFVVIELWFRGAVSVAQYEQREENEP